MELEVQYLINKGYTSLQQCDYMAAKKYYNQLTVICPDQPIGYIGQVLALLVSPDSCSNKQLIDGVLKCKNLQCSPTYRFDMEKLVNFQVGKSRASLLAFACNCFNYEIVSILVDYGAVINAVDNYNVTPLWLVCRRSLSKEQKTDGRNIAKLLLAKGAKVNVVNTGGVALYNEQTDPQIAQMIRRYYPDAIYGDGPGRRGAETPKISMTAVLAFSGLLIGLVLGTVLDRFFLGLLWGGILAGVGAFLGYQIDQFCSGEAESMWKPIRNIVIAGVVIVLFGVLLGNCVRDDRKFGYCPNCHSRMETKYISDGKCTRCDGTDWVD